MSSLLKDLVSIPELSEENYSKIIEIASGDGKRSIEWSLYLETIDEDSKEHSLALFRILNYIGNAFADSRDFTKEAKELDEYVGEVAADNDFAKQGWNRLKGTYDKLTPFFLSKKEDLIKDRFSNVRESSITVDARPIFSLDRTSIEKTLFPYILKLETCDDKTFLCELYPEQLELLEEEIKNAKLKKAALESLIGTSS